MPNPHPSNSSALHRQSSPIRFPMASLPRFRISDWTARSISSFRTISHDVRERCAAAAKTSRLSRSDDIRRRTGNRRCRRRAAARLRRGAPAVPARRLTVNDINRGFRFGGILFSAIGGPGVLAAGLWFTRFVSIALERQDWVGWVAFGLMIGHRSGDRRHRAARTDGFPPARAAGETPRARQSDASRNPTSPDERKAVERAAGTLSRPADLAWGLARVRDHTGDVLRAGRASASCRPRAAPPTRSGSRRAILKSAKRVATVTALSPIMWIAMGFVLVENVRMFRAIAGLYGGRPGVLGALRLARLVVAHVIATGGIAMTDDLLRPVRRPGRLAPVVAAAWRRRVQRRA